MIRNPLIFAATCDIAGKTRGKAFPVSDWETRSKRGVGWTPTNVQITCFDAIAESPFGALGDLLLIPDVNARIDVDFDDGSPVEHIVLGDVTTMEGAPWELCTRSILSSALERLEGVGGVRLVAAFEHEFQFLNDTPAAGGAYTYSEFAGRRRFAETLMAVLETAGFRADTIMKEYGVEQFEVTVGPEAGLRAADVAVLLRELTRLTAARLGETATFTPIRDPAGVGNGVHIHMSFVDQSGSPATYDPDGPAGMSKLTGSFVAGVLKYLDGIVALTAPSDISYLRLTPHRWSAAYNNLGFRDREAAVRICPLTSKDPNSTARQFNFEFRAGDAAACPHLALAAIVHAGAQGIEDNLPAPIASEEDLSLLSEEKLAERGFVRLPQSLPEALDRFAANMTIRGWFPDGFADVYIAHKQGEIDHLGDLSVAERCAAYEAVY